MARSFFIGAKVYGVPQLEAKMRELCGRVMFDAIREANAKSADEFMGIVQRTIPRGSDEGGHVADSLKRFSDPPMGEGVQIGDERTPYPYHLEFGHRFKNGAHAPGVGFWTPAKRVMKKRAQLRTRRAVLATARAVAGPPSSANPGT